MAAIEMAGIAVVETPVLVVGSSMVGMTLSALLAKYGVRECITVDRHASTAIHARAALFQPRSMQIYREMGLYEQMEQASHEQYDIRTGLFHAETLASILNGGKVGTFLKDINEGIENISPTSRLFLEQRMFEPLLKKHAMVNGADLKFSSEVIDFQQDEEGVTALVQNVETGKKEIVRASFMVACDGHRSFTRNKLGISTQGYGLLSWSLTIYFKGDLSKFLDGKYNGVIYINNESVRGFFRLDKTGRKGFFAVNTYGKQGTEESRYPADGVTLEKAAEMLRAGIGADIDFEITSIVPWRAVCEVAEKFVCGRILLAGDAAHTMTPNGGFGGNTGIQDTHNLAWKLALLLQNKAGIDLVTATYHDERWPVAKKTTGQVLERYITRTAPELKSEGIKLEEEVPEPHLELGYRYHSQALTTRELGDIICDPATADAGPGSMAHHAFVTLWDPHTGHSEPLPIADLLGNSFVLLCGHDASSWVQAGTNLRKEEGPSVPDLSIHQLSQNTGSAFYDKYATSSKGCVLIRPDSFIAWSAFNNVAHSLDGLEVTDSCAVLQCVMRKILCLEQTATKEPELRSNCSKMGDPAAASSLATSLFQQIKALESKRAESLTRIGEVDTRLADLRRMSELQNESAMLGMKLRTTWQKFDDDVEGTAKLQAKPTLVPIDLALEM